MVFIMRVSFLRYKDIQNLEVMKMQRQTKEAVKSNKNMQYIMSSYYLSYSPHLLNFAAESACPRCRAAAGCSPPQRTCP